MAEPPGRAKARGPYAKTAARRTDIVRAARDSFAEHGYAGASLRDIAKRAGIAHAGLQHHFRTKEELLTAVLAQRDDEEWERGLTATDTTVAARSHLEQVLLEHQKAPELMRLWAELAVAASRPDHPAHGYFVDRDQRVHTRLVQGLRERAAGGELRDELDPESAASLLQAVLSGLQVQWLLNPRLDVIESLNCFMSLIFGRDGEEGRDAPEERR
ncbi:TetR/AcrR family transcriptional regulator [Streptomyces sp. NBC_00199]|uniref:TetR/AcrR family transcriptional regulator n=1 Tax=Streptomyces sp. NBC_00199 TaxID=2975678 RepID=UPI00225A609D|nr:TetR/AcrR family transcriptional regulator [Streptomyces sp. NBC_00199]MCX5262599.1 TetR/AcrR family transcriptional regulator [Streptomyces sp. NBC_00199]